MKKYAIYTLALATMSFGLYSCDDESYDDWASPQTSDKDMTAQSANGFSITPKDAINFANVNEGDTLDLFTSTMPAVSTTSSSISYKATLSNTTIDVDLAGNGRIAASALKELIEATYGKAPTERTLAGKVSCIITADDGSSVVLNDTYNIHATLAAPFIASAYYFVGTNNSWAVNDTTYKFIHNDANNIYDDPIFKLTIAAPYKTVEGVATTERDDMWFKIAPVEDVLNNTWDNVLGCAIDGDESLEGILSVGGNALKMPATDGAKFYAIELNMMEYTYKITPLSFDEYVFMPGDHQGWSPSTAPSLASHNFDGIYTGYTYLKSEFKFTKHQNWDDGEYNYGNFTTYSDIFTGEGTGNIKVTTPGYYYLKADVVSGSLTATSMQWGLIGSATAGGWDLSTDMELTITDGASDGIWRVTTTLSDGEFKFRANNGWDYNFGGSPSALTAGGDNIAIEAGTYDITLDLNDASNYHCTIVKQ